MMRFPEITAILFIGIYKISPELIVFRYIFTDCLLRNMDFFHDPLLFFQRKMIVFAFVALVASNLLKETLKLALYHL